MSHDDEIPAEAWAAQLDQALCAARDQARMVASFWHGLVAEGVDMQAATYLAGAFIRTPGGDG